MTLTLETDDTLCSSLEVMQDWPKTELKFILPLHVEEIFFFVLGGIVGLTTKFCFVGLSAVFP